MELPILTSKKGTKVIKSSQLHRALGLNDSHYQTNVKRWITDVYQFSEEIRKPAGMTDYALAKQSATSLVKEYYLSLEFARLIALASRSKVKQAIANKLAKEEMAYPQKLKLDAAELLQLIEQVKVMSRMSYQIKAEERHAADYQRRRGSMSYWNHYRAEMTGYRKETLIASLLEMGIKFPKRASLRELILRHDPTELIRIGLTDHYAAQGHPLSYANEIGLIGQQLAKQLQLEIVDDRKGELLFAPPVDMAVLANLGNGVAA